MDRVREKCGGEEEALLRRGRRLEMKRIREK
jgi:hypothetical protein